MAMQAALFGALPPLEVVRDVTIPTNAPAARREPSDEAKRPGIGTNQCICMGCGEPFNSVSAFDRHQRIAADGSTVCLAPPAITDRDGNPKPMVKNARGWWVTALREDYP